MPTTDYGVVLPGNLDGPAGAAQMAQMAASFEKHLIQYVPDVSARDSRFGSKDERLVVATTQAPWFVWLKTGTGPSGWMELYSDTGVVTTGFTPASGFDLVTGSGGTQIRRAGRTTELFVRATRTGADLSPVSAGNLVDTLLTVIPPQFYPPHAVVALFKSSSGTSGAAGITTSGNLYLFDAHPGSTITNGSTIDFLATWLAA